jgi:acetyl esterase
MIDPVLQHILNAMAESGFQLPEPLTAQGLRAALDTPMPVAKVPVAEVRDVRLGGVATRLYHPAPGQMSPVAFLMHGGGWVIGTLETADNMARRLANQSGCAILSVDYRLAPEHPFPAPLDDCLAAIAALPSQAAELGLRAEGYAVIGDSAGGNLAAAVALALAGKAEAPLRQVLFYPVIDRDFETASYLAADEAGVLTPAMMRFFWDQYVGDAEPEPLAAPIRASSLAGVAPATVILAGLDPLHDEGAAYVSALRKAGVAADLHDFAGAVHGFASFAGLAPIGDQAVALAAAALKAALAPPAAGS